MSRLRSKNCTAVSPRPVPSNILESAQSTMSSPIRVAVLDDYQGISEPKFRALDPAKFQVEFFKDTLRPFNHPETTQEVKDALVRRLEPFTVICKCRTRTNFNRHSVPQLNG